MSMVKIGLVEQRGSIFDDGKTSDPAVQPKRIARGLKFWIDVVEGLFYLCSKTKRLISSSDLLLSFHMQKTILKLFYGEHIKNEPRYEKTSFLHMRKQRRRSAAQ